ncbi:MAG: histidine kinase dimerization/phospho-acceptor domain-containing protein [Cyanobacteria bacterium P01_C01_bin.72]
MLDNSPFLKEFISPIPICQPDADLGNMLRIFQHLNCEMLAIAQDKSTWGVLRAEDLLLIVAETWLGEGVTLVGHPRNAAYQQNISRRLVPDIATLVKTVQIYQGDLRLGEFLKRSKNFIAGDEEQVCLIINRQGELLGKLDDHKVIKYLAQESLSPTEETSSSLETSNWNYFTGLLAEISLPGKIETATGQVIQTNELWQQLVKNQSSLSWGMPSRSPGDSLHQMTRCWVEEQQLFCSEPTVETLAGDRSFEHNIGRDLPRDCNVSHQDALGLEVVKVDHWNLLKIPLVTQHYLILATPIIESQSLKTDDDLSPVEIPTSEILETVGHELKSPLTGIVGLSSLLREQQLGTLNQRQARYVELIYRSGKKMMGVVDDLLRLKAFTAEVGGESELINLEFLCRQLYQSVLTKVKSLKTGFSPALELIQPQLKIELGSEIAIANKLLLSAVLTHLFLEVLNRDEIPQPLKIEIESRLGMTAIIISSQTVAGLEASKALTGDSGFNLTMAQCLAQLLDTTITQSDSTSQLILLLPKSKMQTPQLPPSPTLPGTTAKNLTILCLYPELEVIEPQISRQRNSNFDLKSWSDSFELQNGYQHRIIEADSLEQAHNLARIWRLDAIILNGEQIAQPDLYLRSLQEYQHLATLPLITLDTQTTEAANQIEGLNVYPCLLPAQQCRIEDLIQVIQIAIES